MLQEKYLSVYHFSEKHTITVKASPEKIYALVGQLDFRKSRIIRFLFKLRGMPARMMRLEGLSRRRFIVLEHIENREIIIGLVGQFWKPNGNLLNFLPEEFTDFNSPNFVKATWNFMITPAASASMVETETRIYCCDEKAKRKFSRYWFFIRPFSGVVRREILKIIRKQAEG